MSVSLYLVFEDGETGPESRAILDQFEILDQIAEEISVTPISAFFDEMGMQQEIDDILDEDDEDEDYEDDDEDEEDELEEEFEDDEFDEDEDEEEEEDLSEWFPVSEGLESLGALIEAVKKHPTRFENHTQLVADLETFRKALSTRKPESGWNIAIDY